MEHLITAVQRKVNQKEREYAIISQPLQHKGGLNLHTQGREVGEESQRCGCYQKTGEEKNFLAKACVWRTIPTPCPQGRGKSGQGKGYLAHEIAEPLIKKRYPEGRPKDNNQRRKKIS